MKSEISDKIYNICTKFIIAPARIRMNAYVMDKSPAISLIGLSGESLISVTKCCENSSLNENECLIKDYSENTGILNNLISHGLITYTLCDIQSGHAVLKVCRMNNELLEMWKIFKNQLETC